MFWRLFGGVSKVFEGYLVVCQRFLEVIWWCVKGFWRLFGGVSKVFGCLRLKDVDR